MPWAIILLAVCAVIGPFDALYLYIRRDRRRKERGKKPPDDAN